MAEQPVEEIASPNQPDDRIFTAVHWVMMAVFVLFTALYLYHAGRLIAYPYTTDYGEGFILRHANELANFRNPYQSIENPPWLVVNYPPVYSTLVAVGIKVFGLQFHFGRLLSLLGILVSGFALYRMVMRTTSDRLAAAVAALTWMTAYPVYNWGTHHRVDSVGLAFEALGLLFLLDQARPKAATAFFLLALFTRQTLWVGPLAGYLYLRRFAGPRSAARWFGGLLLAGGFVFAALTLATQGEFFRHLVVYNANKFHWKDVWVMTQNVVMDMMQVSMAFLLYYILRSSSTRRWDLAAYAAPLAIGSFLLVGKIGAATNYLFELTFVAAWCTGLAFAEARVSLPPRHALRLFLPVVLTLSTFFPLHLPHLYGEWRIYDWGGTPSSRSHELTSSLVERLEQVEGPIFSQDAGVALLAGHDLVWDPFVMTQLSEQKMWEIEPFHQMIREKRFNAVVLPCDLDLDPNSWTDGWWSQLSEETARLFHQHYRVVPLAPIDPQNPNPRVRGYFSPFGTNYLYIKR